METSTCSEYKLCSLQVDQHFLVLNVETNESGNGHYQLSANFETYHYYCCIVMPIVMYYECGNIIIQVHT